MKPVVVVENLSFTYSGAVVRALDGLNLKVYPGQFLTITGPSGCGKSTLALCLAGFIPHAYPGKMEGAVRIQGRDTRDYPAGALSGIVGLVQQDPEAQLCTLTVKDEVAFGPNLCLPPAEIRERGPLGPGGCRGPGFAGKEGPYSLGRGKTAGRHCLGPGHDSFPPHFR